MVKGIQSVVTENMGKLPDGSRQGAGRSVRGQLGARMSGMRDPNSGVVPAKAGTHNHRHHDADLRGYTRNTRLNV